MGSHGDLAFRSLRDEEFGRHSLDMSKTLSGGLEFRGSRNLEFRRLEGLKI